MRGEGTLLERAGSVAANVGRDDGGRSRWQSVARWVLIALVVAFLGFFLASQWDRLPQFDWRFSPGWLAVGAVAVAAFYVIQAQAWLAIVRGLGARIDPHAGRSIWGKSLVARYVPTNALMVVGRVLMVERHGVGRRVCMASIVYELGLAIAGATLVAAYFVITMPALADVPARYAVLAVVPAVLIGLHPSVFERVARAVLRKLGREPLAAVLSPARVFTLLGVYVLSWIAVGSGVFAFASAIHPVGAEEFPYVASAQAVAFGVAVATVVSPSGLGPRDAALAIALAVVLPLAVATAIAIAFRIFQTVVELAFVGAMVWVARRGGHEPPAAGTHARAAGGPATG